MKKVVFVCTHNAGRSQIAEAFVRRLAAEQGVAVESLSAGTLGGRGLNPMAVQAMAEVGIDISAQRSKLLTPDMVAGADRIITMGCGVNPETCPTRFLPTEDWQLPDPAGLSFAQVRELRDTIEAHVRSLLAELTGADAPPDRPA